MVGQSVLRHSVFLRLKRVALTVIAAPTAEVITGTNVTLNNTMCNYKILST